MKLLRFFVVVAAVAIVLQCAQSEGEESTQSARCLGPIHFGKSKISTSTKSNGFANVPADHIVLPYEGFQFDQSKQRNHTYWIENKLFVEDLSSRCHEPTVPENPLEFEPSFVIVSPKGQIRVRATARPDSILAAGFDPSQRIVIIVHGYTQSYPFSPYLRRMRDLFQANALVGRQNLIIMDYSNASKGSYAQTAAATGVVSSFLTNFIMKLVEQLAVDRTSIHLIGNSLGAQIASLTGKRIKPNIGRITALDPAGPCFGRFGIASHNSHHRLDPSDANEVIVEHYDKLMGIPKQLGHVDIFVNGGSKQPGCSMSPKNMLSGIKSMITRKDRNVETSHTRGQDLITSPLPDWCQQVAYECASYHSFTRGECGYCNDNNDQCYLMSMYFQYKNPIKGSPNRQFNGAKFYLSTHEKSPYCSNHYQILVKLDPNAGFNKFKEASLELLGDDGEAVSVVASNRNAPSQLSYLLLTEKPPTRFKSAKIVLSPSKVTTATSSETLAREAITVEVNFMSNINPEVRKSFSSRLCSDGTNKAQSIFVNLVDCE